MHPAVRIQTTVLPGGRVEVTDPQLSGSAGQPVEVILVLPASCGGTATVGQMLVLDFLGKLPAGPRSAPTWEEFERAFGGERDSWDR